MADNLELDFSEPDTEERILRHPLVQAELEHQLADLQELDAGSPSASSAVLQRARLSGSAVPDLAGT